MAEPTSPPAPTAPDPHQLKGALKSFRKKLKVLRLDKESRQIAGPLSKGTQSGIVAITPPSQYPAAVWEELVKQGKLKYEGNGLYALVGEQTMNEER